jgi:hypothetical protein
MNLKEKFHQPEKLKLFIIILLLNLISFALGFIIGAKVFIENPIVFYGINQ